MPDPLAVAFVAGILTGLVIARLLPHQVNVKVVQVTKAVGDKNSTRMIDKTEGDESWRGN